MSLNILVIPEDFRKDEHLLQPILDRMLAECGKTARVRVCRDPLLGGVHEALKWERIREILDRYRGMVTLFLLIVDRDGQKRRRESLDRLEREASHFLGNGRWLLAENAWEEVEVWALAGMKLPSGWNWHDVRAMVNVKETYFREYVEARGLHIEPFEGRQVIGREAARNYSRIRQLCPEDVATLESRIRQSLGP